MVEPGGDGEPLGRSLSWFVGRLVDYVVRDDESTLSSLTRCAKTMLVTGIS